MRTTAQIKNYIDTHEEPKRSELLELHKHALDLLPGTKLWFLDGKDADGKIVSNPSIGYGSYQINYADGTSKEFYQVGLSTNTTGISVYIMGLKDKKYLKETYGDTIGKATVTGYCIKFKHLKDINVGVLKQAMKYGVSATG